MRAPVAGSTENSGVVPRSLSLFSLLLAYRCASYSNLLVCASCSSVMPPTLMSENVTSTARLSTSASRSFKEFLIFIDKPRPLLSTRSSAARPGFSRARKLNRLNTVSVKLS